MESNKAAGFISHISLRKLKIICGLGEPKGAYQKPQDQSILPQQQIDEHWKEGIESC